MIRNYLKIAFRNIRKQKAYALINILGLAVGLASFILIMLWVKDELSYESLYKDADRIFLLHTQHMEGDKFEINPMTPYPLASSIRNEIPEALKTTKFRHTEAVIRNGDKIFRETAVCAADASFFELFSNPFIAGNRKTALSMPHSCVITEKIAEKYFGTANPIGKTLIFNTKENYTVTGIIEDTPYNTHLDYEIFIPLPRVATSIADTNSWSSQYLRTYLLAPEDANQKALNIKLTKLMRKHLPEDKYIEIKTQPISKLHLQSPDNKNQGMQYVYLFTVTGILIILIACINFMNIAISLSLKRAREIGLKKVVGAGRGQLITQFMSEAFIQSLAALIIAMVLVELLRPFFNELTGKAIILPYLNTWFLPSLGGLLFLITLLAGSYPAFLLSSFKPVNAFRGNLVKGKGKDSFRKILVIFQFAVSIALIIGSLMIFRQLHYISHKSLGFEAENVIFFPVEGNLNQRYEVFYQELMRHPGIAGAARALHVPGSINSITTGLDWEEKADDKPVTFSFESIDEHYIETMGMDLISGRNFSNEFARDSLNVIINEEAIKVLGFDDPVGKNFWIDGKSEKGKIIGVVRNFNAMPLMHEIKPLIFTRLPFYYQRIFVRLQPGNPKEAISHIKASWNKYVPGYPFDYHFLDQRIEKVYNNEMRIGKIALAFTILAILITCIGLFGLASHTARQKTREIGIRRVFGASSSSLVWMFVKNFAKWVLIANLIAWPLAWYFVSDWLTNFAYRIEMQWHIFLLAALSALILAIFTVIYQSWTAAMKNPVETLKYE
ncbi:MAG: ABC transporter permease [Bacteroidales bacterium]|nr:ABC transporter permease [Bacteroidales bacterium]